MPLGGADIADAAVVMPDVVQMHEAGPAQVRASLSVSKPLTGNSGRYLAVRNSDSA
jgi:hypothetical protein